MIARWKSEHAPKGKPKPRTPAKEPEYEMGRFGGPIEVLTSLKDKLPKGWKVSSRLEGRDHEGEFSWRIICPIDIPTRRIRLPATDPRASIKRSIERE